MGAAAVAAGGALFLAAGLHMDSVDSTSLTLSLLPGVAVAERSSAGNDRISASFRAAISGFPCSCCTYSSNASSWAAVHSSSNGPSRPSACSW